MEAKDVSIPTRVVCPTQRLGQRTTHKGHRAGGCKKSSSAGGERACPASLHLHKQRAQCATVLDLSTVVVRAVRRGSRRGSQRNGRASRALGARLHKQRAQCATVLDLSTVGVTGVRGQESQILVLGGVRPKQGAPKMKRPERRVLFHRTQPRLRLLHEGLQPTRRGRPRTQPHPVGRYLPGDTLSGLRPRTRPLAARCPSPFPCVDRECCQLL